MDITFHATGVPISIHYQTHLDILRIPRSAQPARTWANSGHLTPMIQLNYNPPMMTLKQFHTQYLAAELSHSQLRRVIRDLRSEGRLPDAVLFAPGARVASIVRRPEALLALVRGREKKKGPKRKAVDNTI